MEEAKSQSLEEDFDGQATHTGKQSLGRKPITKSKLNLEISTPLTATIQYEIFYSFE